MDIYQELEQIFRAGLGRVNPYQMLKEHVTLDGGQLQVNFEGYERQVDLGRKKLFVLGTGKAAAPMARAIEEILGERLEGGIVSTKYGHAERLEKVQVFEAGHPVPDENSLRAGETMRALAGRFDRETLVVTLISGGGSALVEILPKFGTAERGPRLTLDDLQRTNQVLLECGATINELNCIRKHLSAIKGGQFVRMIQPAQSVNFILSDVVGDRLDAIASGLTAGDPTTYGEAGAILEKYAIRSLLPAPVRKTLEMGAQGVIPETPKPGDPIFETTQNILVGTNAAALQAAAAEARQKGYRTVILTSQLVGEAREVAKMLLGVAKDVRSRALLTATPACIIAGGETTVTVTGNGKGGRNQEMALSFLNEMGKDETGCEGITFLSAATDGGDGPTDAAGAYASLDLWNVAGKKNMAPEIFLKNNDAYHFFEKAGGLLKTGATRTNVCDIQICIIR
jgi:glycerate 2-kinase